MAVMLHYDQTFSSRFGVDVANVIRRAATQAGNMYNWPSLDQVNSNVYLCSQDDASGVVGKSMDPSVIGLFYAWLLGQTYTLLISGQYYNRVTSASTIINPIS